MQRRSQKNGVRRPQIGMLKMKLRSGRLLIPTCHRGVTKLLSEPSTITHVRGDGMVNKKSASTPLEELQNQFSIIELGGEFRVVSQIQIEGILGGKNFEEPAFYKKTDSTIMMKRFLETLPYVRKPQIVISDFWISPKTVVYKGTAFTPKPSSSAALNFWVGPIAPDATGNAAVIFNHLLKVICDDDPVSFDYLIGYLAHMIQKPAEKPGVMIVMLGRQGDVPP